MTFIIIKYPIYTNYQPITNMDNTTIDSIQWEILRIIFQFLPKWYRPLVGFTCRKWRSILLKLPRNELNCDDIASVGWINVLKWAREHGCHWDEGTCAWAAVGGHLDVLKWAREHGCPWDEQTCSAAAGGGHLEVLQWAREHDCPWDRWTCWAAVARGHLEVLKWARENACPCGGGDHNINEE
jgi:hypothetical protein